MRKPLRLALAAVTAAAFAVPAAAQTARPPTWHVFLIAADHAEPVFDNAVDRLAGLFRQRFGIVAQRFSARYQLSGGKRPATWPEIGRVAQSQRMAPGDACLFYFTSHGDERGLYMARHRALLPPDMLAQLLDRTCGRRPTVVVVSACHSGTFLRPGVTAENRVILTAARADRSSFGCAPRGELNVYDRCFLESWPGSATWLGLHAKIAACVRAAEHAGRFRPPSEPQAYFGRLMRDFPIHPRPLHRAGGTAPSSLRAAR